jgi:hypothetical protein
MELSLPLDNGFLRRECPNCRREFKWHHGPTSDRPLDAVEPEYYACPYCGQQADNDAWWTREQSEVIQQAALAEVSGELDRSFRGMARKSRGGGIRIEYKASSTRAPLPLQETDDMATIASPCHCIVCGQRFVA